MPAPSPAELRAQYQAAEYQVFAPEGAFTLRVGVFSEALRRCHARHGCQCSAFVTAWNPRSEQLSAVVNQNAQQALLARLMSEGLSWLSGAGVDPRGLWLPEESVLVLGMEAPAARQLGREFGQHAVLVAAADATPQLLWIQDSA